jgi:large subunit ribosomal protein L7Ae
MFILATQLFKLLDKYRPETKEAKKERLKLRAVAKAEGKVRYFILLS